MQPTVARRERWDKQITAMAAGSEFTAITRRLRCLRGVSRLTGSALAVEVGDWTRLSGASIGAYLGLTPSQHSSGESRRQGGITTTGDTHARRLLVEAAWHHKPRYDKVGETTIERWDRPDPTRRRPARVGEHQQQDAPADLRLTLPARRGWGDRT